MTDTTTTEVTDIDTVVEAYFAMLNEADATRRAELIATTWHPDGAYADPLQEAAGHQGLSDMVAAVQAQYPGRRFQRTSAIDSHHGFHRFGWQLGEGDDLVVDGIDVAQVGADGRLVGVAAFFGPLADEAG